MPKPTPLTPAPINAARPVTLAIVLGDEILAALVDLNCPLPGKPVARLWATFANPNNVGRYLRVNVSTLPMEGVRVRAFEMRVRG